MQPPAVGWILVGRVSAQACIKEALCQTGGRGTRSSWVCVVVVVLVGARAAGRMSTAPGTLASCRQSKKLAAAEEAVLSKKELENVIADLRRQLGQAQADNSMLQVPRALP